MNDDHYEKDGPVFFYDAGEADVSDAQAAVLLGEGIVFAPLELARKYHGLAIV